MGWGEEGKKKQSGQNKIQSEKKIAEEREGGGEGKEGMGYLF